MTVFAQGTKGVVAEVKKHGLESAESDQRCTEDFEQWHKNNRDNSDLRRKLIRIGY